MAVVMQDAELLLEFRNPSTKEKAFTAIIKKYQEKLYWHIRRMVVEHEDANDQNEHAFPAEAFPQQLGMRRWLPHRPWGRRLAGLRSSALARRVPLRGGRNARPVSSGPSGPTRGQAGAPAGRQSSTWPSRMTATGGRGRTSLTPGAFGPGGISAG